MTLLLRQNFARGLLAADIDDSVMQLTVSASNLPTTAGNFILTIWDHINFPDPADDVNLEIVSASYSGTPNVYDIVRAQEGTSAVAHSSGVRVALHFTAGMSLNDLINVDHGSIQGLGDDDHSLYHTDGRAAAWLGSNHETTYAHSNIALNTTHRSSDGSNHTFINQNVTTTGEPIFAGLTVSDMIQGSVLFAGASGLVSQDNDGLFWDDTNKRLGVGVNNPNRSLVVHGANASMVVSNTNINNSSSIVLQENLVLTGGLISYASAHASFPKQMWFKNYWIAGKIIFGAGGGNVPHLTVTNVGDVGINTVSPDTKLQVVGDCKFGDDDTNYSQFESDGTYVMTGAATVFEDIIISLSAAKVPAANAPTWATFIGNLKAYTYSLNDFQEFSTELSHAYKEGATIEFHIHGAVNGLDGDDRTIKFEVEYSIVDVPAETGFGDVYPAPTIISSEITISASTTDLTSFSIDIGDDTSGAFGVGAIIKGRVRRIASSGTEPAADPFVTEVGIHIENDTIGSRTVTAK